MKTDSGLISALHTFGKYNSAGIPRIKPRKNLQGSKIIGVPPTTIFRRKVYLGGRKVQKAEYMSMVIVKEKYHYLLTTYQ